MDTLHQPLLETLNTVVKTPDIVNSKNPSQETSQYSSTSSIASDDVTNICNNHSLPDGICIPSNSYKSPSKSQIEDSYRNLPIPQMDDNRHNHSSNHMSASRKTNHPHNVTSKTHNPLSSDNAPSKNVNISSNEIDNSNETSEDLVDKVSTESFLNFLSIAYKLNNLLDSATADSSSTPGGFDMSQLSQQNGSVDQFSLKLKLTQVLNEGLLDSILPYLIPPSKFNQHTTVPNSSQPVLKKALLEKTATSGGSGSGRKYSNDASATKRKTHRGHTPHMSEDRGKQGAGSAGNGAGKDVEVEIHVCDEVKNLKRDFKCSQKLLVSKMGYFAQVTMGQRLEDMDISVHCDINIFEWLMRWVKKDSNDKSGNRVPELDCCNVIAVLVSANFLQMEPLLLDCLQFCKQNMNEIIRSSNNLVCINDSVLSRIALQFSNLQVEELDDKKDKIRSRLFCKLVLNLNEWPPVSARGHWASTGRLYRCLHCGSLLSSTYAGRIACKPTRMSIDAGGNLVFSHEKDTTWSLTEHIRLLRSQMKDWGRVYWRLWSQCHLLCCVLCNQLYPVCDSLSCAYHPQPPQFMSLDSAKLLLCPIGRYPCCGGQAFRFEALHNFQGCHFKPHIPRTVLPAEASIQKTIERLSDLVCVEPPQPLYPPERRLARVLSFNSGGGAEVQPLWWRGLALIPGSQRQGLLRLKNKGIKGTSTDRSNSSPETGAESSVTTTTNNSEDETSDDEDEEESNDLELEEDDDEGDEEGSDSGTEGEEDVMKKKQSGGGGVRKSNGGGTVPLQARSKHKTTSIRHWTLKQSTRCNQDNQREMEETLFSSMASQLLHQTHIKAYQFNTYLGGAYVKLEQDWKDSVKQTPPPVRSKYRRGN